MGPPLRRPPAAPWRRRAAEPGTGRCTPSWLFSRRPLTHAGPNGCGKSSLLDAVCFAGAAPPRSFPGGSLAGLANSDTSEVGAAGRCRVLRRWTL